MAMPKAAVHKNNCSVFSKYQIGVAWKTRMIYPIAEASVKKKFTNQYFRLRILPTYGGHIAMALFFGQFIHIRYRIEFIC